MSFLRIQNLYKTFDRFVAVNRISLEIKEGEFFTLLGSSGCGKTTTLRMIGGLEKPDGGEIYLGEKCLVSATKRAVPFAVMSRTSREENRARSHPMERPTAPSLPTEGRSRRSRGPA